MFDKLGIILLGMFILGCSEKWEGFVYPDKTNLNNHRYVGEFKSLETCRAEALSELRMLNALQIGDYECGKNCRSDSSFPGTRVCEKTVR